MSIRIGILGYGNLGRGVECAIKHNPDMELVGVFMKQYARLQQIRKDAQNVKKQYTIYGESKDHIAYVEFDIMTVGGKQYLGKDEEW